MRSAGVSRIAASHGVAAAALSRASVGRIALAAAR
jgi:hypothetical protein